VRPFRHRGYNVEEVANRFGAGIVISTTMTQRGRDAHITMELQNQRSVILGSLNFDVPPDNVLASIPDITEGIAEILRPRLGEAVRLGSLRSTAPTEAAWNLLAAARAQLKQAESFSKEFDVEAAQRFVDAGDRLALRAIALDKNWPEPHILRGQLAAVMAWAAMFTDRQQVGVWFEKAAKFASDALRLDSTNAAALELRGRATYNRWAFGAGGDETSVAQARQDMEHATVLDGSRAVAWSVLSLIALDDGDFDAANHLANQALDADAFFDDRANILDRLFRANFGRGDDASAKRWCSALRMNDRAPWPAVECELMLQGWSETYPFNLKTAWAEIRSAPPDDEDAEMPMRPLAEILYSAILWRADSTRQAQSLLGKASQRAAGNPEADRYVAAVLALMGRNDEALEALGRYIDASPAERNHVRFERWFRTLDLNRLAGRSP
jgi:tetratricopeptide (TPR) repeat protein